MPTTNLPFSRLLSLVVAVGALLVLAALAANTEQLWIEPPVVEAPVRTAPEPADTSEPLPPVEALPQQRSPVPDWAAASVLVAIAALAIYLAMQHAPKISLRRLSRFGRGSPNDQAPISEDQREEEIIRVTTDLIDELSIEGDPRAAIQRAYAAVETGFGSRELARKPAETPMRYLQRVFGRNLDQSGPLQQLTGLFEAARFSAEPITEDMRTQAIAAFAEIRDHYRSRRRGRVR